MRARSKAAKLFVLPPIAVRDCVSCHHRGPPSGLSSKRIASETEDMVVLRPAVLLFATVNLMVATLGFLVPKTSISAGSGGFLGEGWQGEGRARGHASVLSRREVDPSMRLGVSYFRQDPNEI